MHQLKPAWIFFKVVLQIGTPLVGPVEIHFHVDDLRIRMLEYVIIDHLTIQQLEFLVVVVKNKTQAVPLALLSHPVKIIHCKPDLVPCRILCIFHPWPVADQVFFISTAINSNLPANKPDKFDRYKKF